MKRWGRILLNTLTAISLLMPCLFLYRSLFFQERVAYTTTHRYFAIRTNPGTLTFEYLHYPVSPFEPGWHAWHSAWNWRRPWDGWHGYFGPRRVAPFIIGINRPPDYSIQDKSPWLNTGWTFNVPFWSIVVVALFAVVWRVMNYAWLSRERAAGVCPACGYDMRANPARCSECGHEPKPA